MPSVLSRLRGLLAPSTLDQPLRLADSLGGSGGASLLTTKGDILGRDTAPNRIPVGADGQLLTADSTAALGVSWKPSPVGVGYYQELVETDGAIFFVPCTDGTVTLPTDVIGGLTPSTAHAGAAVSESGGLETLGGGQVVFSANPQDVFWLNPLFAASWTGDFSIEAWFKTTNTLGVTSAWYSGPPLLMSNSSGSPDGWGLALSGTGYPTFGTGAGGTITADPGAGVYNDGEWHHAVGTYEQSSGLTCVYIDGQLAASGTGPTSGSASTDNAMWAGFNANGFTGGMTGWAIYQAALDATQVATHYEIGRGTIVPGSSSPLTTKGDLFVYSTTNDRLPIGTNTQVLTADSSQATGMKWAAAGGGVTINGNVFMQGGPLSPDSKPGTPNAMDDEFEGTSLAGIWSWVQQNSASVMFGNGTVALIGQVVATNTINAVMQALPGGGAWRFRAKAALSNIGLNHFCAPITLIESGTGLVAALGLFNNGGYNLIVATGSLSAGYTAVPFNAGVNGYFPETILGVASKWIYWEVELAAGTLHYRVSNTGLDNSFLEIYSVAMTSEFTTACDTIGFSARGDNASIPPICMLDWFRRMDGAVPPNATPVVFESSAPVTLSALGSAAAAGNGARAFITDATSPVFGNAALGGGAVNIPVYSDGAVWRIG